MEGKRRENETRVSITGALTARPWILNLAIVKETLKASNGKIRSWY